LHSPAVWLYLANDLAAVLNGDSAAYNGLSTVGIRFNYLGDALESGDQFEDVTQMNDNWKTGSGAPVHGIKPIRDYINSKPETSYLLSRYEAPEFYNQASWLIPTPHNFHPRYYPSRPPVKTAEPILILSPTWDIWDSLVAAKKAHATFEGSALVEQKAYGYSNLLSPYTDMHIRRYLHDGTLPEANATYANHILLTGKANANLVVVAPWIKCSSHQTILTSVIRVRDDGTMMTNRPLLMGSFATIVCSFAWKYL